MKHKKEEKLETLTLGRIEDLITDLTASCTDKYERRFSTDNNNNYIVNTNFTLSKALTEEDI